MPKPKLTPKQTRIVKRKVEAVLKDEPQKAWAQEIYPDADQRSAEVLVSRELTKVDVQVALQEALEKHGITIEKATKPIADGLEAMKQNNFTGEFTVDHSIRLKAAGMALDVLGAKGTKEKEPTGNTFIQINNNKGSKYAD